MSSIVISGDTSGTLTLAAPAVSGTNTATLPAATGTVMVSGNMPAFSAYVNSAVSITNSVYTKITFQAEEFDTASAYDNVTNYRFQPLVAGYYQINSSIYWGNGSSLTSVRSTIYKNGSIYKIGAVTPNSTIMDITTLVNCVVYLNGSTDYVEIYGFQNSGGTLTTQGTTSAYSWFNGSMVRSA